MRIAIAGATGFIGRAMVRAVEARGHEAILAVRRPELAQRLFPGREMARFDFRETDTPPLPPIDAAINAAGIITEQEGNTFHALHVDGPLAFFSAAHHAGAQHLVQISALGVRNENATPYNNTKRDADNALIETYPEAITILRPGWLYGPGSQSQRVLAAMAALPFSPVVGNGHQRIQPIAVDDLANAAVRLIEQGALKGQVVETGGPDKLPFTQVLTHLRGWAGGGTVRPLPTPLPLVRLAAWAGDKVFKGPINRASLDLLTRENITDDQTLWRTADIAPAPMEKGLARTPAEEAEIKAARTFFFWPLARYVLAVTWILSGLLPLLGGTGALYELLARAGVPASAQSAVLWGSTFADMALGAGLLIGRFVGTAACTQALLILGYTLFLSVTDPAWWLHPYGVLTKNLPMLMLTLLIWRRA